MTTKVVTLIKEIDLLISKYYSPPRLPYCGLTFIFSQPSRHDENQLLSGTAGQWFTDYCLSIAGVNRFHCEFRLSEDKRGFLPNTKGIIILGEKARKEWKLGKPDSNIFEQRGSIQYINHSGASNIASVCTFNPQDCMDIVDHEARLNPYLLAAGAVEDIKTKGSSDEDPLSEKRRHGRTSRSNYRFWVMKDFEKLWRVVKNYNGIIPFEKPEPEYILQPKSDDIIYALNKTKDSRLYIDIETDANLNVRCIGLSLDEGKTVYVVPVIRYNYTPAYNLRALAYIFEDLDDAFARNTVVAHNGGEFDFFVLAYKYRLAIRQGLAADTMIEHRRCFPEVEKSLGHCTSLWTYQPFHKDEGELNPHNHYEEQALWRYCGKDVYTMALIQNAIDDYSKNKPGLKQSIQQANNAIYPFLTMTMKGLEFDEKGRSDLMDNNDRLMEQYLRIINTLVGKEYSLLPTSPKSMVRYFHELLNYKVVSRTSKGAPSLAADAIYKLKLLYPDNPVLDFCLGFRRVGKETGTLKFNPMWSELGQIPERKI